MKAHHTYPHYWINHLGFVIRKQLVQGFAQDGLNITAEEWAVLLILSNQAGITGSELSDQTMRDRTTVTRMVDRLVRKGLVSRQPDQQDRRMLRLSLTEAGRVMYEQLSQRAAALIKRSLTGLEAAEIDATVKVLSHMSRNLTAAAPQEDDHGL